MVTSSVPAHSEQISQVITRLRALSQITVQAGWRYWEGDLPIAAVLKPQTWQTWPIAELNARDHVAWSKGQRVCWLAQRLTVPSELQGYPLQGLCLRLALTWWAEAAQIFVNGELVQEGDLFDCSTRLLLSSAIVPGTEIEIALRLVSPGHDDGALVRSVCLYESLDNNPEPSFVADELAVLHHYLQTFALDQLSVLADAVALIDWAALQTPIEDRRDRFNQSLANLRQQLLPFSDLLKQRTIYLLGHAHLDMAWLWPVEETWRAAERTFQSALQLQQDFPELIFCHSTPALYDWIEQHRPDLFQPIQQQVQAGRWEPIGGLWVEPELNLISGEAIVRHLLYGQRYFQQKFGSINRIAWLPDSFGFNGQLPQLLQQGGIEYFVTQKLRWNDTTQFPYEVFQWQSPDGSQVFSLMSAPIGEGIDPIKMATYACDWEGKTGLQSALWLPGVGDHGGGPTRDMLELARRWQRSPFFPTLKFTTAIEYLQQIEAAQTSLPSWNEDLYLEFHRGCYTTHAEQKRFNRRSEALLYQAELWASLATIVTASPYPQAALETAWKQVLFNQFHDILPGSSIPAVFEDANRDWEAVEQTGRRILDQSLQAIAAHIQLPDPPHPAAQPIVVFNSLNWPRSQVVTLSLYEAEPTETHWKICDATGQEIPSQQDLQQLALGLRLISFTADQIPGIGYRCFWLCPTPAEPAVEPEPIAAPFVLENESLRVTVNPATGELSSVFDKVQQWEVLSGAGNQLQTFEDKGQYWDAWNIDPNYAHHPGPAAELKQIRWLEQSTLRSRLQVIRQINNSTFQQEYSLEAGSPLLTIKTTVDWRERHLLVKAAFPLNLETDRATYEIPCGAVQRTTRPESDRQRAQWEVPALHWADLSDAERGVSLLNNCKYGYDSQPGQLRLTLLRGSQWPDPKADLGRHQFTYALYPHRGSWQTARTVQLGYELNQPLLCLRYDAPAPAVAKPLAPVSTLLELGAENLVVMAFKPAEASAALNAATPSAPESPITDWVLRCYECCGQTATLTLASDLNLQMQTAIDLLERPSEHTKIQGQTAIVPPWKIASFRVKSKP